MRSCAPSLHLPLSRQAGALATALCCCRASRIMTKPQRNECLLTGSWIVEGGKARGDAACERINWLLLHHFQKISDSAKGGAWETLYRDPEDGRYWERTYPQGELHGGGPPQLRVQDANNYIPGFRNDDASPRGDRGRGLGVSPIVWSTYDWAACP